MEKIYLLLFLTCVSLPAFSQNQETYTASNGLTYVIGDTITLGVGSEPDGAFSFIYSGLAKTIFATIAEEQGYDPRLPDYYQGQKVVIKKIRKQGDEYLFTFTTDDLGAYVVSIENAIRTCEIAYCRPDGFLSQEEFEKLILLYRAFNNNEISEDRFHELRKEMLNPIAAVPVGN